MDTIPSSLRRAALTSRWIGFASIGCGAMILYGPLGRSQPALGEMQLFRLLAVAGFIVPGMLYGLLPTFLVQKKRWALFALMALALLTLLLMGLLFVMELMSLPASLWLCAVCLTWVVAVAVLCSALGRTLPLMNTSPKPRGNAQKSPVTRR